MNILKYDVGIQMYRSTYQYTEYISTGCIYSILAYLYILVCIYLILYIYIVYILVYIIIYILICLLYIYIYRESSIYIVYIIVYCYLIVLRQTQKGSCNAGSGGLTCSHERLAYSGYQYCCIDCWEIWPCSYQDPWAWAAAEPYPAELCQTWAYECPAGAAGYAQLQPAQAAAPAAPAAASSSRDPFSDKSA